MPRGDIGSAAIRAPLRLGSLAARSIQNRSKPKMRGAEVHFLRLARGRSIAGAVVGSAQERAALDDAAWRLAAGQRQIPQFWSARIDRCLPRVTRPIPVARPLPDIADHVVEAVTV